MIHAAAHFANENSIINPERDLKTNILGTLNILEYCRKKKLKNLYTCLHHVFMAIKILQEKM